MIGDDIEITIVDIRGDKVRLGITAPATIPVHRKEVYEAIQRENREAAKVKMEDLLNLPTPPHLPKIGGRPVPPQQKPGTPVTRPPSSQSVKDGEKKTTFVEMPAEAVQELFDRHDPKTNGTSSSQDPPKPPEPPKPAGTSK